MVRDVRLDALKLRIDGDASGLNRALRESHNRMLSFEHSVGAVNAAMRRMAIGFAGLMAGSVKLALDFDKALVRSNMTLNVSADVIAGVRKDMLKLSQTTTHSATELAQSLEYLGQAGLSLDQIMDKGRYTVVKFVSAFARAGSFELKTATDLLTDSATAMKGVVGLTKSESTVQDMVIIGNELTKMASATNSSVSQLAQALTNKAGPAARMFNISLKDTVTLLGVYAAQGKKGAAAGSLLEQTMRYLTSSYSKNEEAYKRFNINPWDADTNQFKMLDFIKAMNSELSKLGSVPEKYRFLTEELGMSAKTMMGIFPLIGMEQNYEELIEKAEKAADVQERLNMFVETSAGVWQVFLNQMQSVGIEIGEVFLPVFTDALSILIGMAKAFSYLIQIPFFQFILKATVAVIALTAAIHGGSIVYQALTIMMGFWLKAKTEVIAATVVESQTANLAGMSWGAYAKQVNAASAAASTHHIITKGVVAGNLAAAATTTLWAKSLGLLKVAFIKLFLPLIAIYAAVELLFWAFDFFKTDDFDMALGEMDVEKIMAEMQEGFDNKVFDVNINPIMSSRRLEDSFIQQIMSMANPNKQAEMRFNEQMAMANLTMKSSEAEISRLGSAKFKDAFGMSGKHMKGSPALESKRQSIIDNMQGAYDRAQQAGATDAELAAMKETMAELNDTMREWVEAYEKAAGNPYRNQPMPKPEDRDRDSRAGMF